jgi:hypothetical protein
MPRIRFRLRWLIWAGVAGFLGFAAYRIWGDGASASVADVARRETVRLERGIRDGHVHAVTLVVRGRLNGPAAVELPWGDEPQRHKLDGEFDFVLYRGDYYGEVVQFDYVPGGCTEGFVSFSCTFNPW